MNSSSPKASKVNTAERGVLGQIYSFSVVRRKVVIWALMLFFSLVYSMIRMTSGHAFQTDLLGMFPADSQHQSLDIALKHVAGVFERDIIFIVEGDDKQAVIDSAVLFQHEATAIKGLKNVSAEDYRHFGEALYQYRHQLLLPEDAKTIAKGESTQLTQEVIRALYSFAGGVGVSLEADPWHTYRRYMLALADGNPFTLSNGLLLSEQDERYQAMVQFRLIHSPYDSETVALVDKLNRLTDSVEAEMAVTLWKNGAAFYATAASQQAVWEISVIGGGALVSIILFLIFLFRSIRPIAMALLSIGSGMLFAASITLLIFKEIHIFALVMGSSLIGISFDYAFHYLSAYSCGGREGKTSWIAIVLKPALLMGLCSSALAYACLYFANLPVLSQLATFSITGLTGALVSVFIFFPHIKLPRPHPQGERVALRVTSVIERYCRYFQPRYAMMMMIIIGLFGGLRYHSNDDIRILQAPDAALKQHEQRIQALTGRSQSNNWIVTFASTREEVLRKEEVFRDVLDNVKQKGALSSYTATSQFLPSQQRQEQFYSLQSTLYEQQSETLQHVLGIEGSLAIEPFHFGLAQAVEPYIPKLLGVTEEGQWFSLVMINDVNDLSFRSLIPAESYLVNYVNGIGEMLGQYRQQVIKLLFAAIAAVSVASFVRFGRRRWLKVITPPVCAVFIAIAVPAAFAFPITLFHCLGLFLVLGIGLDYSIFFHCHGRVPSTVMAVLVAGISTLLSFGLMSLSTNYAIASFGLTLAIGVLSAWLLTPLFVHPKKEERTTGVSN